MADESGHKPVNPLVRQVDTLLRSHQEAEGEVPVLTDVIDFAGGSEMTLDPVVLEATQTACQQVLRDAR